MGAKTCAVCGALVGEGGSCPECLLMIGLEDGGASVESFGSIAEMRNRIPGFEIEAELGRGGMGVVYRAKQLRLDRTVAIKILSREALRIPGFTERFRREAKTMAGLAHPNIVTVYDFGEVDGLFYLVMEFVDGANLRQILRAGQVSEGLAEVIVLQVCEALHYAHGEGVVHRDIKPENIFLDQKGRAKLGDFGLARMVGDEAQSRQLTESRHVMGTPHYMAPEQVNAPKSVDQRADIYAVGVLLYELLTGELPVGRFLPPSHAGRCDPRLDAVVLRALEHRPENRYQRVTEVAQELSRVMKGHDARNAAASTSSVRPVRRPIFGRVAVTVEHFVRDSQGVLAVLGLLSCLLPWTNLNVDSSPAVASAGGLVAALGFGLPLFVGRRSKKRSPGDPVPVFALPSGAIALTGVLIAANHPWDRPGSLMVVAAFLAILILVAGIVHAVVWTARWSREEGHLAPRALHDLARVVVLVVALLVSFGALPWAPWVKVRNTIGPPDRQVVNIQSLHGFEHPPAWVAVSVLLILSLWISVTFGLRIRPVDGALCLIAGFIAFNAGMAQPGYAMQLGSGLSLVAGSAIGLLGLLMLVASLLPEAPAPPVATVSED